MCKDILLCSYILRHIPVYIQMIGCKICNYGDVGAAGHGHQLERTQFQYGIVPRPHFIRLAQQRTADVSANVNVFSGLSQKFGDQRGRGGLPVASGNSDQHAGSHLKEDLHFGGNLASPCRCCQKLRNVPPQSRRAKNHVLSQILKVFVSQLQRYAKTFQPAGFTAQILPAFAVAGGDTNARFCQKLNQRRVADADPHNGHGFFPNGCNIFL